MQTSEQTTPGRGLASAEELLRNREIRALKIVSVVRVVMLLIAATSTLAIGKSPLEKVITTTIALVGLLAIALSWFQLLRQRSINLIGWAGSIADVLFICSLPWIWFYSVGGPTEISPIYMLKNPNVLAMGYGLMMIHSMAGRARYVLVLVVGLDLGAIAIYVWGSTHPEFILSSDFVTHILGGTLSFEFWLTGLLSFTLVGLLLAWHVEQTRRGIHEAVRRESEEQLLSRYFSPGIRQEILRDSTQTNLSRGRRRVITIMFCDLRGFTALSESLEPEQAMQYLREYHEAMVSILFKHGGTLDKFLGDGILATFGSLENESDHARRALAAALEMRDSLRDWNAARQTRGEAALQQGIGLHTGPAIIGNVGVTERLEYTVIGDTVNLASRVEGLCKALQSDLLLTADVLAGLSPDDSLRNRFESLGDQQIRGRQQAVTLFRPRIGA